MDGVEAIEGAAAFLASLPADRWAIVTSSPRRLALRRLAAAGLPTPAVLVTAEDVERGKPAPDCFLLAAERLGQRIEDCLVFEDAPAGIQAAEAAGAAVAVVTVTHRHALDTSHPTITGYGELPPNSCAEAGWVSEHNFDHEPSSQTKSNEPRIKFIRRREMRRVSKVSNFC